MTHNNGGAWRHIGEGEEERIFRFRYITMLRKVIPFRTFLVRIFNFKLIAFRERQQVIKEFFMIVGFNYGIVQSDNWLLIRSQAAESVIAFYKIIVI